MTNRLANETSPYLLQHAHNPVNWYPWGPEALERARQEDKPILVSIGYSACHWCHVMERESFENEETARLMNDHFINIKVDREERPDIDEIYMTAVQAMTGHGGWPLNVFLTPDLIPFFGGTYFPPEDHPRMASWRRVLTAVADLYQNNRDAVNKNAQQMRTVLQQRTTSRLQPGVLRTEILDEAFHALTEQFDNARGGFGAAPKFPQPMNLEFLARTYHRTRDVRARRMLEHTLDNMARGGIYDQLGGGFHRYSVDAHWLVPHFEKMLYDNAQLARLYLHAFQMSGSAFYRRIAEETLDYVLREMTGPEGGFHSAQDADSEGEEGKFYIWTLQELEDVLGREDAVIAGRYLGATPAGNFEGRNILHVPNDEDAVAAELGISIDHLREVIERSRPKLLEARSRRVWPAKDDKVITAWNGLMLRALAEAGAAFDRREYIDAAVRNAGFVLGELYRDGRLLRTWRAGVAHLAGYLEDYAFYSDGLLALYEATGDLRWFSTARDLVETMIDRFWDEQDGGFFDTPSDHEELPHRPKDLYDNVTPAGNSAASGVLLQLSALTGRRDYADKAIRLLRLLADHMARQPTAFGHFLGVLDFYLSSPKEIAVIGDPRDPATRSLLAAVWTNYLPNHVLALKAPGDAQAEQAIALLEERDQIDNLPTAYVCQNFACQMPVTDAVALADQLGITVTDQSEGPEPETPAPAAGPGPVLWRPGM